MMKPAKAPIPDPSAMLPAEGLTAVLQHAVMAYPLVMIILVIAVLAFFFGIACLTVVKVCCYWVLRNPHAGEVILALKQQENDQARFLARPRPWPKPRRPGRAPSLAVGRRLPTLPRADSR